MNSDIPEPNPRSTPEKKNNYLTVSQEEVMDKVAEMYNTNNSFFVYVFAAS